MKLRKFFLSMSSLFFLTTLSLAQSGQEPKPEDGAGKPLSNTIKWATASEVDNFGFDIYRADSEDGPFTKINESPVEGAGTTDSPTYYSFIDDTIDPNKPYFYYVESISMDGVREQFTPIIKAKPKVSN